MKKLLIMSLMLAMVLAAVPAFAQTTEWWSGPFTTIMTKMTAGSTIIVSTNLKYSGNIYMETKGNEVLEVTFCGYLGPSKDDVEIDFMELPQLVIPESLVVWGFGDPNANPKTGFNDHTTGVSGPAFFDATGILLENSSDAVTQISLMGEVYGSGGSSYPYSYLLMGGFSSILTPLPTPLPSTPICHGRPLP